MKPKLPCAERLAPYLGRIDSTRIYSNFGPLACSLEERLAAHYRVGSDTVTMVTNATLGLMLALTAQDPKPGSLCIMPAWTFVASAHAATMAGLVPYFIDVDGDSWAIDPRGVGKAISSAPAAVGAVMPVVPFGRPIDMAAWDKFRSDTGLPVVIDAAAAFDAIVPGAAPVVVSLHATKVLAVGEGGFVMSTDSAIIRNIRARANFGFAGTREAAFPSSNAKLSEYHAAVGHAALDEWPEVRAEWMALAGAYRAALGKSNGLGFQDGFGNTWVTSTCVVGLAGSRLADFENALARAQVETRRWWGEGAHAHRATAAFPRTDLPATRSLAQSTLALPLFRGLERGQVQQIAEAVRATAEVRI